MTEGRFEAIASDGVGARAYAVGEAEPGTPGVVLFHAWWGLNGDVVDYADRLAGAGFAVIAPDMYGGALATTIEEAERLSRSLDEATADVIALASIDRLADRLGPAARIASVGFSMGAAWSVWSAAMRDRVLGSVVYYGSVGGPSLARATTPVLGHFAETDPYEPDDALAAFEGALRGAGRDVVVHRYPGTGHWFAEPSVDAYRPAAADLAFDRTVEFLGRVIGDPVG